VKSAPVYFYVQRSSEFAILNTPIPFTVARVNEGNAMNLATGKFTAPRNGIYFFAFTAEVNFPADSSSYVDLYKHRQQSKRTGDSTVNVKLKNWRSSLGSDLEDVVRGGIG
jgi:hypothetical protein